MTVTIDGRQYESCPKCQNTDIREYANFETRPGYINWYKKCMNEKCRCSFDGMFIALKSEGVDEDENRSDDAQNDTEQGFR